MPQLRLAPDGTPLHYERHCPEQTTLYRLERQHARRTAQLLTRLNAFKRYSLECKSTNIKDAPCTA